MKVVVAVASSGSRLFIAKARENSAIQMPESVSHGFFIKDQDIINYMINKFPDINQISWTLVNLDEDL